MPPARRLPLGRWPSPPDARDLDYRMAAESPPAAGAALWPAPYLYDQGDTPDCTAYSSSGAMTTLRAAEGDGEVVYNPVPLYQWANAHDGLPQPHDGSTVRAAMQGLVALGDDVVLAGLSSPVPAGGFDRVTGYLWGSTTSDDGDLAQVVGWLLSAGPVVVGTTWTQAMFTPDAAGVVHPSGNPAGGHAYELRGVSTTLEVDGVTGFAVLRNSWGAWGGTAELVDGEVRLTPGTGSGDALLSLADLATLLEGSGEAAALVVAVAPSPTPAPLPPTPAPIPPTPTPPPAPPAPSPAPTVPPAPSPSPEPTASPTPSATPSPSPSPAGLVAAVERAAEEAVEAVEHAGEAAARAVEEVLHPGGS